MVRDKEVINRSNGSGNIPSIDVFDMLGMLEVLYEHIV